MLRLASPGLKVLVMAENRPPGPGAVAKLETELGSVRAALGNCLSVDTTMKLPSGAMMLM